MPHRRNNSRLTARTADRHRLYSEAVQSPDCEIAFIQRVFRRHRGRPARLLREDFCGTALICCEWVRTGPDRRAVGIDLDPEPLAYARRHLLAKLTRDQAARVCLRHADVLTVRTRPVDVVAALNFSYCVFKQRPVLLRYLTRCRAALRPGGLMVLDIYGGTESQQVARDRIRYKGFTYVWEQARFNPITHEALNHIHFHFPDGSRLRRAFSYDWRLWTPAELTDALTEAGFSRAAVYWEGTTRSGEGDGKFRLRRRADQEPAWVAYVVGFR